ncbi:hypothetical protein M758_1G036500 [Ceratodon purpureus]|nr:hypothetical protein M758_1G036500 [Ceratodon purpureus]
MMPVEEGGAARNGQIRAEAEQEEGPKWWRRDREKETEGERERELEAEPFHGRVQIGNEGWAVACRGWWAGRQAGGAGGRLTACHRPIYALFYGILPRDASCGGWQAGRHGRRCVGSSESHHRPNVTVPAPASTPNCLLIAHHLTLLCSFRMCACVPYILLLLRFLVLISLSSVHPLCPCHQYA